MKKQNLAIVFICIVIFIVIPLRADSTDVITDIRIEGNHITKEHIIRREIHHSTGIPFDSLMAKADRNRIDNLEIFSEVYYSLVPNEVGSLSLIFYVVEAWRIFPIPFFNFQEETGWSYGAALLIKNFRGRNEMFQASAAGGGTTFGSFQFQDPWIMGDHVSLRAHLFLTSYDHPYLGFAYRETDGELTLGRYFGYQWKLWISGSIEERNVTYFNRGKEDLKHNYFQAKLRFIYDTRDLYINPSRGVMIFNELQPDIGLGSRSPHNLSWNSQISIYQTVIPGRNKWVAGASFFFRRYMGDRVPYRIMMVGGAKSVRGWAVLDSVQYRKQPYRAGLNNYFTSFELRQTLIPKQLIAPRTEFGIILAEFIDIGVADNDFSKMFGKRPIAGTGIGLRIFIPGAQIIRIDYGMGIYAGKWQSGNWHLILGQKF